MSKPIKITNGKVLINSNSSTSASEALVINGNLETDSAILKKLTSFGGHFMCLSASGKDDINNYALLQSTTNGATFINASSGQTISMRINDSNMLIITDTLGIISYKTIKPSLSGFLDLGDSIFRFRHVYGVVRNTSDDRLKDNETDIHNALNTIMKLKPQTYNLKSSEKPDAINQGLQAGFIAQDVLEIPELEHTVDVPEVESVTDEETGEVHKAYMSLNYNSIFVYAVKAIQELNEKVTALENEIQLLKNN